MSVLYFQCPAGVSGDMLLGAWLDIGVPEAQWQQTLAGLNVSGYTIEIERVMKKGIAATKVYVHTEHEHKHRHLPDIVRIIEDSQLPMAVKQMSIAAFTRLAEAEAKVHGTTPDRIHFHEVGAVDAIVDIVGSMIAWDLLGQPTCVVSPIEVGGGTVQCAHGIMPVPAPATAALLQGFPTYSSGVWGETATPTGAAILATLATPATRRPFVGHRIGYGAGTKELQVANVIRIQLGDWADSTEPGKAPSLHASSTGLPAPVTARVIEANIDDMPSELAGHVLEKLLTAGAMDVTWTPIVMKKSRPALKLTVLCSAELAPSLQEKIFRETSTIGMRIYDVDKFELPREIQNVDTPYGGVPVKVARLDGDIVNALPEYEACRALAQAQDVPLKQVYQAALAEASRLTDR